MDACRCPRNLALLVLGVGLLATSTGCNPLGWGISQIQHLIHHHAQRPEMRDAEKWPGAGPQRAKAEKTSPQPA